MLPAPQLGQKSQNCPRPECTTGCGVCEHKQYVFDNSTAFNGDPEDLINLVDSVLLVHEGYMRMLCDYQIDICKRGELANFPCIQCGQIDPNCIELGEQITYLQSDSDCKCFKPLDFSNCEERIVDLSQFPYLEIFEQMVIAIDELSFGFANGQTVEDFLKRFLPDASLLFFRDNTYHFTIGQSNATVLSILPIIQALSPLPFGAKIRFYLACPDTLDPFGLII